MDEAIFRFFCFNVLFVQEMFEFKVMKKLNPSRTAIQNLFMFFLSEEQACRFALKFLLALNTRAGQTSGK